MPKLERRLKNAAEKVYCDLEMAKTEGQQADLEDTVAKFVAKIDSDAAFSGTLAKAGTEEADAASEYGKTTQENKVSKTMMDQDVKYKSQEAVSLLN